MENKKIKFAFFGTDSFSVNVLEKLKERGFLPKAVITAKDKPSGRGQKIQKPVIKIWAEENQVHVLQPEKLDDKFRQEIKKACDRWDFFVVASYGKIIPQEVLNIPVYGSLNVHPSLLPKYRGASPIESAILDDQKETGVTIMLVDEQMDHGPILNQEVVFFEEWPTKKEVEKKLAEIGGILLSETIISFLSGNLVPQEQDHAKATFSKKIKKEDGETSVGFIYNKNKKRELFLKIQALNPWPGVYFFIEHNTKKIRIKITDAKFKDGTLEIIKVLPEGKREMDFKSFERGFLN